MIERLKSIFKIGLLTILIFHILVSSNAQTPSIITNNKNAVYVEFFGNGFNPSINYERSFKPIKSQIIRLRTGFSFMPNFNKDFINTLAWNIFYSADKRRIFTFPIELFSSNQKFPQLEYGIGFTTQYGMYFMADSGETWKDGRGYYHFSGIVFRIGYRYESPSGHFLMRLGFTPYLTNGFDDKFKNLFFIPLFGYSLGYMF